MVFNPTFVMLMIFNIKSVQVYRELQFRTVLQYEMYTNHLIIHTSVLLYWPIFILRTLFLQLLCKQNELIYIFLNMHLHSVNNKH